MPTPESPFERKLALFFPLLPSLFFLLITFGFWGEYPSLDPMLNFRDAAQLHQTGFKDLSVTVRGASIHPPLLNLLISTGFTLFGKSPFSYNLIGFILFAFCSLTFYRFVVRNFNRFISITSTLLLFCNPMVITNFFNPSYEIATFVGLILLINFYSTASLFPLAITLSFFPLMKETALSIPLLFLVWQSIAIVVRASKRVNSLFLFVPFFAVWTGWLLFSKANQLTAWQDSYFPHVGGPFQIVIDNLLKLNLVNTYFKSNLFNLFIFNFHWVYSSIIIISLILIGARKELRSVIDKMPSSLILLGFLSFGYGLLALGFPTWTIVRYPLPIYPFIFLLLSLLVFQVRPIWFRIILVCATLGATLLANLGSYDPITFKLFPGHKTSHGVKLYDLPFVPYSLDSANYNRDFLKASEKQNDIIRRIIGAEPEIVVTDCNELKLGEKLWTMFVIRDYYPQLKVDKLIRCVNTWDWADHRPEPSPAKTIWID